MEVCVLVTWIGWALSNAFLFEQWQCNLIFGGDEVPFRQCSQEEIEFAIRSNDERPKICLVTSRACGITWCWKVDPMARPKAHEILDFLDLHFFYPKEVNVYSEDTRITKTKDGTVLAINHSLDSVSEHNVKYFSIFLEWALIIWNETYKSGFKFVHESVSSKQDDMTFVGRLKMEQTDKTIEGISFQRETPNRYLQSTHITTPLAGALDFENIYFDNQSRPEKILNDPELLALQIRDPDIDCIRQIFQSGLVKKYLPSFCPGYKSRKKCIS